MYNFCGCLFLFLHLVLRYLPHIAKSTLKPQHNILALHMKSTHKCKTVNYCGAEKLILRTHTFRGFVEHLTAPQAEVGVERLLAPTHIHIRNTRNIHAQTSNLLYVC